MKRIYLFGILCPILFFFWGCNNDQQKLFSGETSLHFALTANQLDSMSYSFLNTLDNRIIVNLPVELDGYADKDYRFCLRVDEQHTTAVTGKHYQALEQTYQIKKGEYKMEVPVILNYTDDLDSVTVRLALELVPDGDLVPGIFYRQKVIITSSNLVPPIPDWEWYYSPYFGDYSKVKHRYILSVLKLNSFMQFEDTNDWFELSESERKAYGMQMNNFFTEHEINDEYGQPIEPWLN